MWVLLCSKLVDQALDAARKEKRSVSIAYVIKKTRGKKNAIDIYTSGLLILAASLAATREVVHLRAQCMTRSSLSLNIGLTIRLLGLSLRRMMTINY